MTELNVTTLKEVPLLKELTTFELQKMLEKGTTLTTPAHANILIEGELSWGLYIILDGLVGVFKVNKLKNTTHDVAQLKKGNFFGEMSLIEDAPRSASIKALTECNLFYLSKDAFNSLLNQSDDMKMRFYESCIKLLVSRLRELNENYTLSQFQIWQKALTKEVA